MPFQHTIPLEDESANQTCAAFFAELEKTIRSLDEATRIDILMELQSHLFESLKRLGTPYSAERVKQAIDSIDTSYIESLRIMRTFESAEYLHRLPAMASAFWSYIRLGGKWAAVGAIGMTGYALALALVVSAALGLLQPDHVGYFKFDDGTFKLGYVSSTDGAEQFYRGLYSPLALIAGVLIFFGLNKFLLRKRGHKPD